MQLNRRTLLSGGAAVLALGTTRTARAFYDCDFGRGFTPWWGRSTIGPEILSRPVIRNRAGLRGMVEGTDPSAFAGLVESNFARASAEGLRGLMSSLSDVELAMMAACYRGSTQNRAVRPMLLDVLALRLQAADLPRIASAFGYADVYSAIARQAPEKLAGFQMRPPPAPSGLPEWFNYGNMTFEQTYNTFRTAPQMNLLGVSTAMWSTVTLWGTAAYQSFNLGYSFSTQYVLPFVQQTCPVLYESIGATIDQLIENYRNSDGMNLDDLERESTPSYNLSPIAYNYMEDTGGPYEVAYEWYDSYGGGMDNPGACRATGR